MPPTEPARFRPRQYPAPQFPPARPARFARTPPAIFPAILGLLGLGLVLRQASVALDLPGAAAEVLLGATTALWLLALFAYGVKIMRRPAVVAEDLRVLPGRAGLAAATLAMMVVAAAAVPYVPGLARGLLYGGLALQVVVAGLIIRQMVVGPPEAREVTPVWHLSFVGFIVGGLAAVPLGLTGLAQGLLWGSIPVALAIWGVSLWQLIRRIPPAPLRPLLAIHLNPAALFTIVASGLGHGGLALAFAALGALILGSLVAASRWLTVSGFTPFWGAFTFPLTAYAAALYALGLDTTATLVLIGCLALVPYVVWRVMQAWAVGTLAARTNAAEA